MNRSIPLGILMLVAASFVAPRAKANATFTTPLSGANEFSVTLSTATGSASVPLTFSTLDVTSFVFSGRTPPGTAATIQVALPGVNGTVAIILPGFPAAASGSYAMTFDLTLDGTYNTSFLTASGGTAASAEAALMADMLAGKTYINIHDATFPGGGIRGHLSETQNVTPEPGTIVLLGTGLVSMLGAARRKWLGQPVLAPRRHNKVLLRPT